MALVRFLVAFATVTLVVAGWMLQHGPPDLTIDVCPYLQQAALACPAWAARQPVPRIMPVLCYALASIGFLVLAWPLAAHLLDRPPDAMLADYIQRGRDLHERCRREGDEAVRPAIEEWTREVGQFLRRLGHRYVVAFNDFRGVELFASQYDTAVTREIRQRLARLEEFAQRLRSRVQEAE